MPLAEILTPDGDGDEERGIQQLEDFANLSGRSGLHPQGKEIFADPHYRPYQPGSGDNATEQHRKAQADRRNADSPTIHHMSGMATSTALSFGMPRHFRQQLDAVNRRGTPKVLPGNGYGPPARETGETPPPASDEASETEVEVTQEANIAAAARAHGHLVVSHSVYPPISRQGPEIYLG
jgi:hypothetical protein